MRAMGPLMLHADRLTAVKQPCTALGEWCGDIEMQHATAGQPPAKGWVGVDGHQQELPLVRLTWR